MESMTSASRSTSARSRPGQRHANSQASFATRPLTGAATTRTLDKMVRHAKTATQRTGGATTASRASTGAENTRSYSRQLTHPRCRASSECTLSTAYSTCGSSNNSVCSSVASQPRVHDGAALDRIFRKVASTLHAELRAMTSRLDALERRSHSNDAFFSSLRKQNLQDLRETDKRLELMRVHGPLVMPTDSCNQTDLGMSTAGDDEIYSITRPPLNGGRRMSREPSRSRCVSVTSSIGDAESVVLGVRGEGKSQSQGMGVCRGGGDSSNGGHDPEEGEDSQSEEGSLPCELQRLEELITARFERVCGQTGSQVANHPRHAHSTGEQLGLNMGVPNADEGQDDGVGNGDEEDGLEDADDDTFFIPPPPPPYPPSDHLHNISPSCSPPPPPPPVQTPPPRTSLSWSPPPPPPSLVEGTALVDVSDEEAVGSMRMYATPPVPYDVVGFSREAEVRDLEQESGVIPPGAEVRGGAPVASAGRLASGTHPSPMINQTGQAGHVAHPAAVSHTAHTVHPTALAAVARGRGAGCTGDIRHALSADETEEQSQGVRGLQANMRCVEGLVMRSTLLGSEADESSGDVPPPSPPPIHDIAPAACRGEGGAGDISRDHVPVAITEQDASTLIRRSTQWQQLFDAKRRTYYYLNAVTGQVLPSPPEHVVVECHDLPTGRTYFVDTTDGTSYWWDE